ncbi:MAG: HAD family hydrolase [Promethearchaeota archaeon]
MRFDYYLFDLDNSLLHIPNPSEYFDDVLVKTLKTLSTKDIPERQKRNNFWSSGENFINLLTEWGVKDVDKFWKYFDEIDFKKRKELTLKNKIFFYEDVYPVLDKINEKNKKLALVSNTANYIVDYMLKIFKVNHYFNEIFALGFNKDIEFAKPSPKGILIVLKRMNYNPKKSNAIMIGDSSADIIAAKRAKITSCLIRRDLKKYSNGFDGWEHQPDFIIEKLDDLFEL